MRDGGGEGAFGPRSGKEEDQVKTRSKFITGAIAFVVVGLVGWGIYWAIQNGYFEQAISMIDKNTSPALFIALMVLLPLVGFPISIFLIMAGIKFGILYAILLWVLVLPSHTLICFYLARALRQPLVRLLTEKLGYEVPEVPEKHEALFSFVFLAVPGIPYAVKNYLLPLAGIPFRYCVLMNTIVQLVLGIPFIVLGKSATNMDLKLLLFAAGFFVVGFFAVWWLEKRYGDKLSGAVSA